MRRKAFYTFTIVLSTITIAYIVSNSSSADKNNSSSEEIVTSKESLNPKLSHSMMKHSKRISVKGYEYKLPPAQITHSKISEQDKVKIMRKYILSSDYQLKEVIEELRNTSGLLSEDSIQELLFLSLRHCSKNAPFETYESLKDGSLEKLGFEDFFSNKDDINTNRMLIQEAIFTGLIESGESDFLKDLKKDTKLQIISVAMNLGKDESKKWAATNSDILTDKEFSTIASIDSHDYKFDASIKAKMNYNYALNSAKTFKKGTIEEAYAYSNIAIQQYENEKLHNKPKDWVKNIEPGFAKDRTTLGFALGASRFYEDKYLEKKLKGMFLNDNLKVDEALTLIKDSALPKNIKDELLKLTLE